MTNVQAITTNFDTYVELYTNKFSVKPESWFSYLRWLADSNKGHTFQPEETKVAIALFDNLKQKEVSQ